MSNLDHPNHTFLSLASHRAKGYALSAVFFYLCIQASAFALQSKPLLKKNILNQQPKLVALTLDDGPFPRYTEQALRVLKEYGIPATFFVVGNMIRQRPHLLLKMLKEGHTVGNHTYSHPNLAKLSNEQIIKEISRTNRLIEYFSGMAPFFFRPPYGVRNARIDRIVHKLGMFIVLWNVTAFDFRGIPPRAIEKKVLRHVKPGSIILLHDGGGKRANTIQALKTIIPALQKRGYRFVSLWELLGQENRILY